MVNWYSLTGALAQCDDLAARLSGSAADIEACNAACESGAALRIIMWKTPAPDLLSLTWKLEQAIYYEDLQDDPDHPLNRVLSDLRMIVRAN